MHPRHDTISTPMFLIFCFSPSFSFKTHDSVHRRLARHGRKKKNNMNMYAVSNNTPFYAAKMTIVGSTESVQCSRYASANAYGRISDAASNRFCVEIQMDPEYNFFPRKAEIFANDFVNKEIEFNQDTTSGQWCFTFTGSEMTKLERNNLRIAAYSPKCRVEGFLQNYEPEF